MRVIRIQTRPIPGGWRLTLANAEQPSVEADLDGAIVRSVCDRIGALLAPPPVLIDELARTRAEESAGRELEEVLLAPVATTWHGWLGEARGANEAVLVVVDADPVLAGLPWELLGSPTPLEARAAGLVVRLGSGRPLEASRRPVVTVHPLDPEDERCSARCEELRAELEAGGVPLGDDGVVVHLVAHGERSAAETWLARPEGAFSAGSAAHSLHPLLEGSALVVLDICDAGAPVDSVAARFLAQGAQAVLAPAERLALEAARALAHGLYGALAAGRPLAAAVVAGRRAVRDLGRPHPDGRWCTPLLRVASADAALARLPFQDWRPEGWPILGVELRQWLRQARTLAEPHGFVGLEHLLASCPDDPGLAHLRYLLSTGPDVLAALRTLHPRDERTPDWLGTPRLRDSPPPADVDPAGLVAWLDRDGAVSALLGVRIQPAEGPETLEATPFQASGMPAEGVEVLGGPEDGRWFEGGQVVGRASAGVAGLYATSWLTDPYLPRSALTLSEPPTLRKGAERLRGEERSHLGAGSFELQRDDLLWLSRATRVRAR